LVIHYIRLFEDKEPLWSRAFPAPDVSQQPLSTSTSMPHLSVHASCRPALINSQWGWERLVELKIFHCKKVVSLRLAATIITALSRHLIILILVFAPSSCYTGGFGSAELCRMVLQLMCRASSLRLESVRCFEETNRPFKVAGRMTLIPPLRVPIADVPRNHRHQQIY
jgi:hypothetical protein